MAAILAFRLSDSTMDAMGRGKLRTHHYQGIIGCLVRRVSIASDALVSVYHTGQAGIADAPQEWCAVCETHSQTTYFPTQAQALRASRHSDEWCDKCRDYVRRFYQPPTTAAPIAETIRDERDADCLDAISAVARRTDLDPSTRLTRILELLDARMKDPGAEMHNTRRPSRRRRT